jgi:hypothetical protein
MSDDHAPARMVGQRFRSLTLVNGNTYDKGEDSGRYWIFTVDGAGFYPRFVDELGNVVPFAAVVEAAPVRLVRWDR